MNLRSIILNELIKRIHIPFIVASLLCGQYCVSLASGNVTLNSSIHHADTSFSSAKGGNGNDTIVEKANPKTLDFSVHQLFIDTTRTWERYDGLSKSQRNEVIRFSQDELVKSQKGQGVCIPKTSFPKRFISLHKKDDTYYLYDRCDGGDTEFLVKDSLFIIFGTHERSIFRIEEVQASSANKLTFQFTGYNGSEESVTIEKVTENRYRLTSSMGYMTSDLTLPNSVYDFDMIVNHCPTEKVWEFVFD